MDFFQRFLWTVCVLLSFLQSSVASDWQSLVDDPASTPVRWVAGPSVPLDNGYWHASYVRQANSEEPLRGVLARFEHGSTTPVALATAPGRIVSAAVALSANGVLLSVDSVGNCGFSAPIPCPSSSRFSIYDAQAKRIWTKEFAGVCALPLVDARDIIWIACGDQLDQYSQRGELLGRTHLRGRSERIYDMSLVAIDDGLLLGWFESPHLETRIFRITPDGQVLWQQRLRGEFQLPLASGDFAYLTAGILKQHGAVLQTKIVDLATGSFEPHSEIAVSPANGRWNWRGVGDGGTGGVYLVAQSPSCGAFALYALRPEVGAQQLACLNANRSPIAVTTVDRDPLVLMRGDSRAVQLQRFGADGALQWSYDLPTQTWGGVSVSDNGRILIDVSADFSNDLPESTAVLDGDGMQLYPALERLTAASMILGGTIDPELRTLWNSTPSRNDGFAYLSRTSFDNGSRQVFEFEGMTEGRSPKMAPLAIGDRHCIVSGSSSRDDARMLNVLCAHAVGNVGEQFEVGPLDSDEQLLGLGGGLNDMPVLLTARPAVDGGQLLSRLSLTVDGNYQRIDGDVVEGEVIALRSDLSGLIGNTVIGTDARARFTIFREPDAIFSTALWLDDGGLLVSVSGKLTRYSADGMPLWSNEMAGALSLEGSPRPTVQGDTLSIESQPGFFLTDVVTTEISLSSGAVVGRTSKRFPYRSKPWFVTAPDRSATTRTWRLSSFGHGLIAEIAPQGEFAPFVRHWFDCGIAECQIQAALADSTGNALVKISGWDDLGATTRLGVINLTARMTSPLAAAQIGKGRWHDQGSRMNGIVSGSMRTEYRVRSYRLLRTEDDSQDRARSQWIALEEERRISANDYSYAARLPALQSVELGSGNMQIGDVFVGGLSGQALMLYERIRTAYTEPGNVWRTDTRLERRSVTRATQTWFEGPDHWIALDLNSGEGVWGLASGRWYRMSRTSPQRWLVSDEADASSLPAQEYQSVRPSDERALAQVRILVSGCSGLNLRVLRTFGAGEPQISVAGTEIDFDSTCSN